MAEQKIKSVEKGWGESSTFFSTKLKESSSCKVDEIKEEVKIVGAGEYCSLSHTVYRGYKNGKMVFEMGASIDITVTYE